MTFTFLRLGKIKFWDAVFYIAAQFTGAAVGRSSGGPVPWHARSLTQLFATWSQPRDRTDRG